MSSTLLALAMASCVLGGNEQQPAPLKLTLRHSTLLECHDLDQRPGLAVDSSDAVWVGGKNGHPMRFDAPLGSGPPDPIQQTRGTFTIDDAGNLYVVDLKQSGQIDAVADGEGVITKLSPDGEEILYRKSVHPAGLPLSIAVDAHGCAYVLVLALSDDHPVTDNAYQQSLAPVVESANEDPPDEEPFRKMYGLMRRADYFVMKLDAAGENIEYGTYLGGGTGFEGWRAWIAVDDKGHAIIAGHSSSRDFPVIGPAMAAAPTRDENHGWFLGAQGDSFVCKLSAEGNRLLFSTFLPARTEFAGDPGTLEHEDLTGRPLTLSRDGSIYLTGSTRSQDFPVTSDAVAFHSPVLGSSGFVVRLAADGRVILSTALVGPAPANFTNILGLAIVVDDTGRIFVGGTREGTGFLSVLSADGGHLVHSGVFGPKIPPGFGTGQFTAVTHLDVSDDGTVTLLGLTHSSDFPTTRDAYRPDWDECHSHRGFLMEFRYEAE